MNNQNLEMLKEIDFLKALSDQQFRALVDRLKVESFAAGKTICRQGEPGETFYLIRKGGVEVTARNDQGQVFLRQSLKPRDFFGEFSLVTGEVRSATVVAAEDTELLSIGKEDMRQFIDSNKDLSEHISTVLAWRIYQLERMKAYAQVTQGSTQEETKAVAASPRPQERVQTLQKDLHQRIGSYFLGREQNR